MIHEIAKELQSQHFFIFAFTLWLSVWVPYQWCKVQPSIPKYLCWAWGFYLVHTCFFAFNPFHTNTWISTSKVMGNGTYLRLMHSAALSWVLILCTPHFLIRVHYGILKPLIFTATYIFLTVDALYVIFAPGIDGLIDVKAFDCIVFALYLPLYWVHSKSNIDRYVFAALATTAITLHTGTTAITCLTLFAVIWFLFYRRSDTIKTFGKWPLLLIAPVGWFFYTQHNVWLEGGDRWQIWRDNILWLIRHNRGLLGMGLGSFEWIGPIMKQNKLPYNTLHNDFANMFFETGFLGLLVFVGVVGVLFWRLRKQVEGAMLICFLVAMMTYSPLRHFPSMLFAVYLLSEVVKKKDDN